MEQDILAQLHVAYPRALQYSDLRNKTPYTLVALQYLLANHKIRCHVDGGKHYYIASPIVVPLAHGDFLALWHDTRSTYSN